MPVDRACPSCGTPVRTESERWAVCPRCRETFDATSAAPAVVFEEVASAAPAPEILRTSAPERLSKPEKKAKAAPPGAGRSAARTGRPSATERSTAPRAARREPGGDQAARERPARQASPPAKKAPAKKKPPAEPDDWLTNGALSEIEWEDRTAPPPPPRAPRTPKKEPRPRRPEPRRRPVDGAGVGKVLLGVVMAVSLLFETLGVIGGWEDGSWPGLGDSLRWILLGWWYGKVAQGRNWARICLVILFLIAAAAMSVIVLTIFASASVAADIGFDGSESPTERAFLGLIFIGMALLPIGQVILLCTPWISAFMAQQRGE